MCGIVGAMSFDGLPKDMEKVRQEAIIWLMTELLYVTHSRGKDATGINASFADGKYLGLKMGVPSPEFITRFGNSEKHYDGFMKVLRSKRSLLKSFIGHCRKSSIGDSDDNNNNHPVKVDSIIGIHNGTLTNHEMIFNKLKCGRDGEVDSEAIMRLVHVMSKKGTEPFTAEMINEVCLRLAGTYACLVINGDNPNQVATFRDGRPMEFALIKPLSLVVVASEKDFLKETLIKFNIMAKIGSSGLNYPCLLKDDVEMKMMPDDSVAVFDLTQEVKPETKIEDLFEGSKVVRLDKKWKEPQKNVYGQHNAHNRKKNTSVGQQNTGAAAGKSDKAEVGVKAQSGKAADDDEKEEAQSTDKKGRLWNKSQTRFNHVKGVDATEKIGGVEINPDSDQNLIKLYGGDGEVDGEAEIIDLDLSADDIELVDEDTIDSNDDADSLGLMEAVTSGLPEVDPEKVDTLMGDPGKIEDRDFPTDEIEDEEEEEEEDDVVSGDLIEHLQESAHRARKVADQTADTKVMEMAAEVASNLPIYESDADLLLELNISDETVLRAAPLHALANRIMKHLYRVAWAKGYLARKAEARKTTIVDDKEKRVKAEKNIKTMKIMMKILGKAFNTSTLSNYSNKKKCIDTAVAEAFDKGNLISATDIDTLFSAGDFLENPELRQLKVTVLDKEDR